MLNPATSSDVLFQPPAGVSRSEFLSAVNSMAQFGPGPGPFQHTTGLPFNSLMSPAAAAPGLAAMGWPPFYLHPGLRQPRGPFPSHLEQSRMTLPGLVTSQTMNGLQNPHGATKDTILNSSIESLRMRARQHAVNMGME